MGRHGIYDFERGFIPDDDLPDEKPIITNADKIRTMTDEELADFMICVAQQGGIPLGGVPIRWLDWLKQEVRDGDA